MAVTTGRNFTCALTRAGAAYCWGDNFRGQLGTITTQERLPAPAAVKGGLTFRSISAGYDHVCAVTTEGAAYCWGSHDYGKLGIGGDTPSTLGPITEPTRVVGGYAFQSISAGSFHTCAVTLDYHAYCWGSDHGGALGVGGTSPCTPGPQPDSIAQDWQRICFRAAPAAVAGGLAFASISAGYDYTCGVAVDGSAYCWGDNEYGALGAPEPLLLSCANTNHSLCRRFVPTPVAGDLHLASVSTGMFHACGVSLTRKAYCWGFAGAIDATTSAPLGTGVAARQGSPVPVAVSGGFDFRAVNAGWLRSCGVTTDSRAYCWGSNSFGDLGVGNFDDPVASPRAVVMPAAESAPAVGWEEDHACAVTTSGRIFCWGGYNFFGELGTGVVGAIGVNARVTNIPTPVVAPVR
jgi:alpha-tubulin suppressor-like RCC1 family protein